LVTPNSAALPGISCITPGRPPRAPGVIDRTSPLAGERNELILRKYLGIREDDVKKLREEEILQLPSGLSSGQFFVDVPPFF
jgi:crotonobetainyl-CoA:carnitine CoA-transferase CaiB-like acyl-CoA transferase